MVETKHGVSSGHKHKLLLMLDEFPQLKKLEVLESAMAQMGGYGLKAFIVCQSYRQLYDIYGQHETISTNCHYHVLYAPNDEETAKQISEKAGKTTITVGSSNISGNRFAFARNNESISFSQHVRDLVTADEAKRLPRCSDTRREMDRVRRPFPFRRRNGSHLRTADSVFLPPRATYSTYGRRFVRHSRS